jgi:transcriptional regulator with XRE-family HTH domain
MQRARNALAWRAARNTSHCRDLANDPSTAAAAFFTRDHRLAKEPHEKPHRRSRAGGAISGAAIQEAGTSSRMTVPKCAKPRSGRALFLRFLRERIEPEVRDLGPHTRLRKRRNKRVTQEEVAEASGVTREWYAMLESGATAQPSPALLDRLADVLMVTSEERAKLFDLALPEPWRVELRDDSKMALEAFSRLRFLSRRLWAATSVEETLTIASEQIRDFFGRPVLVLASRRRQSGLWEFRPADENNRHEAWKSIKEFTMLPSAQRSPAEEDALGLYPWLENAGDVGTSELYPPPVLKIYARRLRLGKFVFVKARVRSRTNLVAAFSAWHELGHCYSAADRAAFGAFAELTSFALS